MDNFNQLADKFINLPKTHKKWVMSNVAPITFSRWSRQNVNLTEKISKHMSGEPLSDLALHELHI